MNVQVENGYTRTANELMDALIRFRIPGEVRQVLDCIFRKTYGYNKKEATLSNLDIVLMTGLKKQNVSRALSKLITQKVVIKKDDRLSVNKNYKEWISFKLSSEKITKKPSSKLITPVIKSDDKTSSEVMTDSIYKDNKDNKDKSLGVKTPKERDKEIDSILDKFEELTGHIPADKKPRQVAHNIRQLTGTFVRDHSELYSELRGSELTKEHVLNKFFLSMAQKKYTEEVEYLETVKRKLKVYLASISKLLEKEKIGKENYGTETNPEFLRY
jgi:phage replication O-like protein O